jgi:acyl-CoA synthetase (NDP forming)
VAFKAVGPQVLHKSELGAVVTGLTSPDAVADAYRTMAERLGDAMDGGVVQPMAEPGIETIVGVVHDEGFGPLVMFGMGGTAAELLADRAFRILPMTDLDAGALVRAVRGSALLFGYRGRPPVNVSALEDVLLRVGRLAENVPEIAELDLNPVVVSAEGAVSIDARIKLLPRRVVPEVRRLRPARP